MQTLTRLVLALVLLGGASWIGWLIWERLEQTPETASQTKREKRPAPVEVAPIRIGRIERQRTISGTLESPSDFMVAPKISGRIQRLAVNIGDEVTRGDTVCWLEDDELQQALAQAEAELTVARAYRSEADKGLEIATRGLDRVEALRGRGIASDVQHDQAIAEKLAKEAAVAVATAQEARAAAAVETARIRIGYAKVVATWTRGDDKRIVAARMVDEGDTVAANTPLLRIVELDPILGVIQVTERDYAFLETAPPVELRTDAFPGETFRGRLERVSPVFDQNTRQARVELKIPNADLRLRPGMFIRATIVLAAEDGATIVPASALTERGDETGVFVVEEGARTVRWRPVRLGIRQGDDVQVRGEGLVGRVVTLGQQLVKDGSAVFIPEELRGAGSDGPGQE